MRSCVNLIRWLIDARQGKTEKTPPIVADQEYYWERIAVNNREIKRLQRQNRHYRRKLLKVVG